MKTLQLVDVPVSIGYDLHTVTEERIREIYAMYGLRLSDKDVREVAHYAEEASRQGLRQGWYAEGWVQHYAERDKDEILADEAADREFRDAAYGEPEWLETAPACHYFDDRRADV